MTTQQEFCYRGARRSAITLAMLGKRHTFFAVWKNRLLWALNMSLLVTRSSSFSPRASTLSIVLWRTTFVSSSSCWTLMIASAFLGSWYCLRNSWIWGKLIEEGLEYELVGTFAVNVSRVLARTEKAGRTGYSWSETNTARNLASELSNCGAHGDSHLQDSHHHLCCIRGTCSYSLADSAAVQRLFALQLFERRRSRTPQPCRAGRTKKKKDLARSKVRSRIRYQRAEQIVRIISYRRCQELRKWKSDSST